MRLAALANRLAAEAGRLMAVHGPAGLALAGSPLPAPHRRPDRPLRPMIWRSEAAGPRPGTALPEPPLPETPPAAAKVAPEEVPPPPEPTYPGAPEILIKGWNLRRETMRMHQDDALPPLDCDLAALKEARVPTGEALPPRPSDFKRKRHAIRQELAGAPELVALNAFLIALLRKRSFPAEAVALFHRIWREEGPFLLEHLDARWLISSAITFGDHGLNEAQRRIGLAANIFFSLTKLYEFERLHSGLSPEEPFPIQRPRRRRLPLRMPSFSLTDGGLDINLLAQIWRLAGEDPVAGPILDRLLSHYNHEPAGLFHRLDRMRRAAFEEADRKAAEAAATAAHAPPEAGEPPPEAG